MWTTWGRYVSVVMDTCAGCVGDVVGWNEGEGCVRVVLCVGKQVLCVGKQVLCVGKQVL